MTYYGQYTGREPLTLTLCLNEDSIRDQMLHGKLIVNTTPLDKPCVYRFMDGALDAYELATGGKPQVIYTHQRNQSIAEQRIDQFLEEKARQGGTRVAAEEWRKTFGLSRSVYNKDLRLAVAKGLITKVDTTSKNMSIFEINQEPRKDHMTNGMTKRQQEWLSVVYETFGERPFTMLECAEQLHQQYHCMDYYLRLLVSRGIMSCEKRNGKPSIYKLTIDRETHPECFGESTHSAPVMQERASVPMAASGAPRAAAIGC